ncbi:MAG: hypothetical protein ACREAU_00770 [Nitrosopumilaceae archaeon]
MGNPTTSRIITGKFGVSCIAAACDGLITAPFSLYCIAEPMVSVGHHGGSIPLPPGAIQNFYKPVEEPYLIPRDKEHELFERKKIVVVELKIGEKVIEKTYQVAEEFPSAIIDVLNMMNTTKERAKVVVDKVVSVASDAVVRIFNLRKY